jgi:hypothetical protein
MMHTILRPVERIIALRRHARDQNLLRPIVGAYNGWACFGSTHTLREQFITPCLEAA